MVEAPNSYPGRSECQAISVLLPYAIFLEQCGQQQMFDAISHMAKAIQPVQFMWYPVKPFITAMFKEPDPPSINWVLGLISPKVPWHSGPHDRDMVTRQAATTSAALNPEEVHWSVADELLHFAFLDSLQSYPPLTSQGDQRELEETLPTRSKHLETLESSSHTCSLSGQSGGTLVAHLEVLQRWRHQSGRNFVGLRWVATGRISSNN